ncbi:hypothetical protein M0D68_06935 [Paraburkholderia sp. SEWSISQ10-3 4]|uniref:hypothetical protein n=1 Tax=Paraburkholderia TaxID=1822464 RepID=UPI002252A85B|nr:MULTISPECIES: hypothetical protein [Paraburkholderia]MCX4137912.1 hypothetical protein [Paraburkholderia aspalathi]MDN7170603.1 hypothetical protein [Paraburkholderia sp. SEWSISQ10-3 4]MDQ6500242.1 hypothetical protein [Paraburkholderia aspalathi]
MSDISEKLLDETLKSIGPLLSPWRILFFGGTSVAFSPKSSLTEILALAAGSASTSTKTVADWITAVPIWELAVIFFVCSVAIPKISNLLLSTFIEHAHIRHSEALINNLIALNTQKPSRIANRYSKNISLLYEKKKGSERSIFRLKLYSEIFSGLLIAAATYFFIKGLAPLSATFLALLLVQTFYISRKITFLYLIAIAPYNVIARGLQKAGSLTLTKRPFP